MEHQIQDDRADDRRSAALEELLSALDWARCTGDTESVLSVEQMIMLQALLEIRAQVALLDVTESTQAWLWNNATLAADNGGYVVDPDPVTAYLGLPVTVLATDGPGSWYFPVLRKRAQDKARRKRDNDKRRQTSVTSNVTSVIDMGREEGIKEEKAGRGIEGVVGGGKGKDEGGELRGGEEGKDQGDVKRQSVTSNVTIVSDAIPTLFQDFSASVPKPVKKRAVKPEPWHQVFDAIVAVTKADSRASTRSHAAKVAKDLHWCVPPYTADDVHALPVILEQQPWWKSSGGMLSIQVVQRHIGLVRAVQDVASPAGEEEYKSLDQLRIAAIQSRRNHSVKQPGG